jgi:hypothetical protein
VRRIAARPGHGPFSHTFEGVLASRDMKKRHEKWSSEIIRGDTDVHRTLIEYDLTFPDAIVNLLEQDQPADIYSSIVSSQFDADRLDYLRRDKLMTGTEQGGFDWAWLIYNLGGREFNGRRRRQCGSFRGRRFYNQPERPTSGRRISSRSIPFVYTSLPP